jgi:hypothetical protein
LAYLFLFLLSQAIIKLKFINQQVIHSFLNNFLTNFILLSHHKLPYPLPPHLILQIIIYFGIILTILTILKMVIEFLQIINYYITNRTISNIILK